MASKAKSISSQVGKKSVNIPRNELIKVGLAGAAVAFFFTQGLPLWNDDYGQWLTQANASWLTILGRIISPLTSEPQTWGYSDRPGQVLLYKIFSTIFGTDGTGFFLIKSVAFGGICALLYRFARKQLGVTRQSALAALTLFCVGLPSVAAMVFHSEFAVYSQLVAIVAMGLAYHEIETAPAQRSYLKALEGKDKNFLRFILLFTAAVYFGSKIKADVRIVPLTVLFYLAAFRRQKLATYAPVAIGSFLLTLPWSSQLLRHLPPFVPGAVGYSGMTFSVFKLSRVLQFLATDHISVIASVGAVVSIIGGIYLGYLAYADKLQTPKATVAFPLAWLIVAVLCTGIIAPNNRTFEYHYSFMFFVPAILLVGQLFDAASTEFSRLWTQFVKVQALQAVPRHAVATVAVVQAALLFMAATNHRKDLGHAMVAVNGLYEQVEANHPTVQVALAPGFLSYGYKDVRVPAIQNRKALGSMEDLKSYPVQNTMVFSWGPSLDVRLSLVKFASACGSAVFDKLFPCQPNEGAALLKYVGQPVELAQADRLDKQGNLIAARQVLESYLQREPGNHGVAFVKSLYDYRAGDFAKMEQSYDQFAAFYPAHTSIVYNWGLAKQGVQKFAEASIHLERAYKMVPKDYAVGFNLTDAYLKAGKKTRALATMNELMKSYPDNAGLKNYYSNWLK